MKTREIIKYSSLLLLIAGIITAAVFIYRRYLPHKEEKKTENRTIVCIGDSLTFGYGVMNNRLKEAWPYLLDEMLDEYEVLNYGISGATAAKTGRKAYSGSFLDQAIEINADIYFYMLGSNDAKNLSLTAEQFRSDSLRIIERIINETKGELIILLPCPVFEVSGKTNSFGIRNEAIESIIIPV